MNKERKVKGDKAFGQQLKIARKKLRLTQQQVADTLNMERCTYARYELGLSNPSINLIRRFVNLYGIDYNRLFSEE